MKHASDFTSVTRNAPEPFEQIEVRVNTVSVASGKVIGHSVAVYVGNQGHRTGIARAEAEARAVIAAIEEYREKNPDLSL